MKDKITKKIIIIIGGILLIAGVIIFVSSNISFEQISNNSSNEIVPEEEISDKQLRETTLCLYFIDQNGELKTELRKIDAKELISNPYQVALNFLLAGPQNESLKSYIPKDLKVNSIKQDGDILVIDFSKEFINNAPGTAEEQGLLISQIVDTMTEFNDINMVQILVDGEANLEFKGGNINFSQIFTMED